MYLMLSYVMYFYVILSLALPEINSYVCIRKEINSYVCIHTLCNVHLKVLNIL